MHCFIDGAHWVLVGAQNKYFKHKGQQPDGSGLVVVKVIVVWGFHRFCATFQYCMVCAKEFSF
jgi:hypothetical protein